MPHAFSRRLSSWVRLLAAGAPLLAAPAPKLAAPTAPAPSVASLQALRPFGEPLVPVGGAPSEAENAVLARALEAYLGGGPDRFSGLDRFLEAHPASPWRASLEANLGLVYRQIGFYSRALKAWESAWALSRGATEPSERAVADFAVGQLAELWARLGRRESLQALFAELQGRPVRGSASDRVELAKAGLAFMNLHPDRGYRCGPMALGNLLEVLRPGTGLHPKIEACPSTHQGTSLAQVEALAKEVGLDLVAARREPGADVVVPSLVHWKAGHFAALVKRRGDAYLLKDPTFGQDLWIRAEALDEEASGCVLIARSSLPGQAWSLLTEEEASRTWGKGSTPGHDPNDPGTDGSGGGSGGGGGEGGGGGGEGPDGGHGPNDDGDSPDDQDPDCDLGMARHAFMPNQASLRLRDFPVGYTPPRGPAVKFKLVYNQVDAAQPQAFSFSNLGPKWTFGWLSYVYKTAGGGTPTAPLKGPSAEQARQVREQAGLARTAGLHQPAPGAVAVLEETWIYESGGGATKQYDNQGGGPQLFNPTGGTLTDLGNGTYERRFPNGSKEVFGLSDGRRTYLTQRVDAAGNALAFGYDAQYRLVTVTDALGQITTLSYGLASDPLKITQVTDPFGRSASLAYNASGQLASITDALGLVSSFTYGPTTANPDAPADFVNGLTTPYGTHTYTTGLSGSDRWVEALDPKGNRERMAYQDYGGYAASEPTAPAGFDNVLLGYRNTYFWNKRAMALAPGDTSKARIFHWLHRGDNALASSLLESTKSPLTSRVWRFYNQTVNTITEGPSPYPTAVARMRDDGTEQRRTYQYNALGKVTQRRDPAGRTTTYAYSADGLDLLEVRNVTGGASDLLASYAYNAQHRPLTARDASGQTTTFTYNAWGQVTTIANPKGETTTLTYDGSGYLTQIQAPLTGATTSFAFNPTGTLASVTNSEGATTSFQYDALNRRTQVNYPDGTYEATVYDRLDVGRTRDRAGRWTLLSHNALRQLEEVQDPQGRVTRLGWCGCGSLESLTDANGRITLWVRDLQGRVISKVYDDRTHADFAYEGTGRLSQRTDAKGQITSYAYTVDGNLGQVSYAHAERPTPTVSYAYDEAYNQLKAATDGTGTTTFAYNPIGASPTLGAGRLASVTSPLPGSTLAYTYDELGRVTARSVNGVSETRSFDALGRLSGITNPLGSFAYTYEGPTGRLSSLAYPNGQMSRFAYFDAAGLNRLKSIQNLKGDGSNLSTFGYDYDASGQIATWTQAADAQAPRVFTFQYDAVGQLLNGTLHDGSATGNALRAYLYGYDAAGNRTSEQIDGLLTNFTHNDVNQITGQRSYSMTAPAKAPAGGKSSRKKVPAKPTPSPTR